MCVRVNAAQDYIQQLALSIGIRVANVSHQLIRVANVSHNNPQITSVTLSLILVLITSSTYSTYPLGYDSQFTLLDVISQ
jgi:hypothetical protein